MVSWYSIILIYPLISFVILRLLGNDGNPIVQIASEYYLWIAYSLFYVGLIIFFFFGTHGVLNVVLAFILYTIGYFVVSVLRKTVWTDYKEETASPS